AAPLDLGDAVDHHGDELMRRLGQPVVRALHGVPVAHRNNAEVPGAVVLRRRFAQWVPVTAHERAPVHLHDRRGVTNPLPTTLRVKSDKRQRGGRSERGLADLAVGVDQHGQRAPRAVFGVDPKWTYELSHATHHRVTNVPILYSPSFSR